ncbi:ribosomal protein S18 acetylase RimI-like enzyme [Streptomyces griseochromogenes]|uniref:GCN5 family acetyltransferase n=1 Tax=Streptomyces griseochromogenes TaxID=68214 RepID=A0A1B1BA16_9ACTN|nr:cyclophane-containing RiPP N-acetyltransferase HaaN [Streptomyces griseochromogenes]ANP55666.1 GCN5 family acetyltransferase [Streptomyces griseochromogenes]MBP2052707.1 ribosomal protein S18 acetylase RimI-like enzyme [Streptomyces griseochromogenes]
MTVTIRPAEKRDIPAVAQLIEEIERFYGANDADIQPLEERRSQVEEALFGAPPLASALLVADETGDIVGLAAYSFLWPAAGSSHSLFLKELYVRDALRRQGIGVRLMDELRALAATRRGCSRVEWMTDRDNPGARAFYKSLGFAESNGKIVYQVDSSTA